MERYVCVHGHFYQPPRENPWLEAVELQDSAYPYHDWNERITEECYAPNAASRILDAQGLIARIVSNYSRISFNFGPTLLAWLKERSPEVYEALRSADRESAERFSGHGSAIAQPYNHMILPLANSRDKHTQIKWGVKDFQHCFERDPEGMWLPETAVDLDSLEMMAELGIRFTLLAPHQAARVKEINSQEWTDVTGAGIDPSMPYLQRLPSGRSIVLFFYDDSMARAVAFEGLLSSGEDFADRLLSGLSDARTWPQIAHVATDGESYGHHHRFGDMALAYALNRIEANGAAKLTNYGEYLERHPVTREVEICKNTSWSCTHGVERWRNDCGCNSGGHGGWKQAWRAPLREALDWLRDKLAPLYEEHASELFKDPWGARNDFISVILDRSPENLAGFLAGHATRKLSEAEASRAMKLLELQRHAMLMYTSCGWFFDDLSGIETVQVIQYAGRVVQLAEDLFRLPVESEFTALLERAKSNVAEHGDGRRIYEKWVKPAMVDWPHLGAHYAVSHLFETYPAQAKIYCYNFDLEDCRSLEAGRAKLLIGRAKAASEVTLESAAIEFGTIHLGDHNINCGVRLFQGIEEYDAMAEELERAFNAADITEVVRALDRWFEGSIYSLKSLFRDEQRKVLDWILKSTLTEVESVYRQVYDDHAMLARFLQDLGAPVPQPLYAASSLIINADLRSALSDEMPEPERVGNILEEAKLWRVSLDTEGLGYALSHAINGLAERFQAQPEDESLIEQMAQVIGMASSLPFEVNLWKPQNIYYEALHTVCPIMRERAEAGEAEAQSWVSRFVNLSETLGIRTD